VVKGDQPADRRPRCLKAGTARAGAERFTRRPDALTGRRRESFDSHRRQHGGREKGPRCEKAGQSLGYLRLHKARGFVNAHCEWRCGSPKTRARKRYFGTSSLRPRERLIALQAASTSVRRGVKQLEAFGLRRSAPRSSAAWRGRSDGALAGGQHGAPQVERGECSWRRSAGGGLGWESRRGLKRRCDCEDDNRHRDGQRASQLAPDHR
jgi:hypothetical protein